MSTPLTAVLFDVDGTLADTNCLRAVTWREAFGQAGHDVPMAHVGDTVLPGTSWAAPGRGKPNAIRLRRYD
jgi:beta-phosphoglucomutase-like phosphatase (HAD superfamily)